MSTRDELGVLRNKVPENSTPEYPYAYCSLWLETKRGLEAMLEHVKNSDNVSAKMRRSIERVLKQGNEECKSVLDAAADNEAARKAAEEAARKAAEEAKKRKHKKWTGKGTEEKQKPKAPTKGDEIL